MQRSRSLLLLISITVYFALAANMVLGQPSTDNIRLPKDGFIVVPSDKTYGPAKDIFITILKQAKNKIDLSMYQLKNQELLDALLQAHIRGVKVRLVTETHPYKHEYNKLENLDGIKQLEKAGIPIKTLASRFLNKNPKAQAHHKVLIVDDSYAIVMTGNWDTPLNSTRDFALIINKNEFPEIFQDINNIFDADWNNREYTHKNSNLIIGPEHQRDDFIKLFSQAKQSIEIYQQSYNDEKITSTLEKLSNQGIKIKLLMMPFPFGGVKDINEPYQNKLINAKGEVRLNKLRYIHAKIVIIDKKIAYIGSCNFYTPSLDFNREIGVITQNPSAISRLIDVFNEDWELAEQKSVPKDEL